MKRYEFINFEQKPQSESRKTSVWSCKNNKSGAELGEVRWYAPWRQYCFMPSGPTVYSAGCLADIQDFIEQLKAAPR